MWKARCCQRQEAGRLVLIKTVLNSLAPYFMSLFKVPKIIVKQIVKMQRDFFWTGSGNRRGLPLIKWEIIQKPKKMGGLGLMV